MTPDPDSGTCPTLRPARTGDAPGLAAVHTQSWRETYAGLMPDDFLDCLTGDEARQRRVAQWQRTLELGTETVWVAEHAGKVVGFASVGPARDHPGYAAELMTLYSLRRVQGQGVGRQLLQAAARSAWAGGARQLALWVLDRNPARQWYARQGATEAGEKQDGDLREIRMVWDDLGALTGGA